GDPVHGWLVLDKPLGMTSTAAVAAVKRLFNAAKAGHAGTLDPLATGVLPIALGEATKTVSFVMDGAKAYRFTVRWGEATNTDDSEGEVVERSGERPTRVAIEAALGQFTGTIVQVPPQFSAIKLAGERAYDIARDGETVDLAPRNVEVNSLRLVEVPDRDHAEFEAECGKGTYVRAIARDLGRVLGCFGHVTALRRTIVGPFGADHMIPLEKLEALRNKGAGQEALKECLLPVETALDDIPALAVGSAEAARLKQGQSVIVRGRDAPLNQDSVLVVWRGQPIALASLSQGAIKPTRVFNLT
ncbi:MAG: tRNA pseudouridine(55) synthase TruB, partial [Hyphomicrobiales bacterium]